MSKPPTHPGVAFFRDRFAQNPDDPTPLYVQMANALRSFIQEGNLQPGTALPPERDMAEFTALSRVTIRKAIELLVHEGLLRQRRGSGTYVEAPIARIEQPLAGLTSFTQDMVSYGRKPSIHWLAKDYGDASPHEAAVLALASGDQVIRLHRIRLADGLPMAVELAVVPARCLPSLDTLGDSLYQAFEKSGIVPVTARQLMRACLLPEREAALLQAAAGEPALYMERITHDQAGTVIEFTCSHYRGDRFDFIAELTLNQGS
ncbi:GntR family transcriptional regulator [Consotaella aegiceratis]|uniref:GntR family transcriptional regulator n=1 Tax=Consotaella aegiceratis TaxID=3097961 RepID=UPI002F3ED20C